MSNKLCKRVISGSKLQEITMQDVLGGLEEIATLLTYDPWPGDFEIIAIYPPDEEEAHSETQETVVISRKNSPAAPLAADVICYQESKLRRIKSA